MSGTSSGSVLTKKRRKLVRLANSLSTPLVSTPSPHSTILNSTTFPCSHSSQPLSPPVQTPVFNSDVSPQPDEPPVPTPSSTPPEESPQNILTITELNIARRGKIQIWPDGKKGLFCPEYHVEIVRDITNIYKGKFDGAWPSWKKVPKQTRDLWFEELKKNYWWEDHYEKEIRDIFEERGAGTLKYTFKEVTKNPKKRPLWLGESIWKALWEHWNSKPFQDKCDQARTNRASTEGVGCSIHAGGSIPATVHLKKMIDEGQEPTVSNLFLRLYQTKDSKWVEDKAGTLHDKYLNKLSESQASQSSQTTVDGSSSSVPTMPSFGEQMKIWGEATGKLKRGRTCSFGEQGNAYNQSSTKTHGKTPFRNDTITTLVEENKKRKIALDEMQTKLEKERARRKKQQKKNAKTTKGMQAKMEQLFSIVKSLCPDLSIGDLVQDTSNEGEDRSKSDEE